VSVAEVKHPTPSRTRKLSPPAAKVVLGQLSVRIARCTFYYNPSFEVKALKEGFFLLFLSKVKVSKVRHPFADANYLGNGDEIFLDYIAPTVITFLKLDVSR
jgi:hypothetical protein